MFGIALGIDAFLKWLPGFRSEFVHYVSSMEMGQPQWIKDYLHAWVHFLDTAPSLYAYLVAACETCIAIGLILGLFSNAVYAVGIPCMLAIWSTAEGFGGPYVNGTTDIGTSIIYVFVYVALYLGQASAVWSLDRRLWSRLGRWHVISTRPAIEPSAPVAPVAPISKLIV